MMTLTAVEQRQHLANPIEFCLTTHRIPGNSEETFHLCRDTLNISLDAVRNQCPPQAPRSFTPTEVNQFLGHVAQTGTPPMPRGHRRRSSQTFFPSIRPHDSHIAATLLAKGDNVKAAQMVIGPFLRQSLPSRPACDFKEQEHAGYLILERGSIKVNVHEPVIDCRRRATPSRGPFFKAAALSPL